MRGRHQRRRDASTAGAEIRPKWKSQPNKANAKSRQNMTDTNAVVAVYANHSAPEDAVKQLEKSGFDMKKLSVVGKDYHTDE